MCYHGKLILGMNQYTNILLVRFSTFIYNVEMTRVALQILSVYK